MGINTSPSRLGKEFVLKASAAVTAGDLVTFGENGKVQPVDALLGMAFENQTVAGGASVKAVGGANYAGQYNGLNDSFLSQAWNPVTSQFVRIWQGDNSLNAAVGINFEIANSKGDVAYTALQVTTDNAAWMRVMVLTSGKIVILWASGGVVKFLVRNSDGTVSVTVATVASALGASNGNYIRAIPLSGDKFVVFYVKNAANTYDLRFQRFNAAGTLQGSEVIVSTTEQPLFQYEPIECANTDFIINWAKTTTTTAHKFARYNASNTLQGSVVTVISAPLGSFNSSAAQFQGMVELVGGNIALSFQPPSESIADLAIYSSANALVATIDLGNSGTDSGFYPQANYPPLLFALPDGTLGVAHQNNLTTTVWRTYSATGSVVLNRKALVGTLSNDGMSYFSMYVYVLPSVGFSLVSGVYNNSSGQSFYNLRSYTFNGTSLAAISLESPACVGTAIGSAINPAGVLSVHWHSSSAFKEAIYKIPRTSVFGVAQNTAAVGGDVRTRVMGSFVINQSLVGGAGAFNARTATIPGNRGVVAGTNALLLGLDSELV